MTLAEFRAALASLLPSGAGDAALLGQFILRLDGWRGDGSTVSDLLEDLKRILGHVWFSAPATHRRVLEAVEAFGETVDGVGGMTMNERLFAFGLLEVWDTASDDQKRSLRSKVEAT